MKSLMSRLIISHLTVALVGATATFLLVRALTPQRFDRELQVLGNGAGRWLPLRAQVASAVNSALIVGVIVGVACAGILGGYAAYRLTRPLATLGEATRRLAAGQYAVSVPSPGTQELDELAGDIRTLADTLAETEQRRTRLVGEVGHEMRTPLTVVDGYLEGMIDKVIPCDPVTLGRLLAETRRLRRLADDLSSLSRAEEGRFELRLVPVDAAEVVSVAANRLRAQAEDAGIHLVVGPQFGAGPYWLDPDRLAQVVTNLVGNALRACQPGGRVLVETIGHRDQVIVRVVDDGVGLHAEDLDRIFERFYRVRHPHSASEGGTDDGSGIGLTISRRIVQALGGTLTAASPGLGQGATFTVTLPAHTHDLVVPSAPARV